MVGGLTSGSSASRDPSEERPSRGRPHPEFRLLASLAVALLVAACSAAATPTPSASMPTPGQSSPSEMPWLPEPTDTPYDWSYPTPSWVAPTAESTEGPQPTEKVVAPSFKAKPLSLESMQGKAGPPAPAQDGGKQAATAINDFGFDLLRHLDQSGNLCFSPASIEIALAMARAGARGETATEMDAVMRSFGAEDQAAEIVALLQALAADNAWESGYEEQDRPFKEQRVRLDLANAAFFQHGFTVEQAYLDALSSRFSSPLYLVDFDNEPEKARQQINDWVYNHTQGRIPEILHQGDVDSGTLFALANAMYLQARWGAEFNLSDTKSLPFTRIDGSKVSVPMMAKEAWWMNYASGTGWRAVDLPYYGDTISMAVVVPDNMSSFVAGLDAATLRKILASEKGYDVTLFLPRFKADTHFDLGDALKAMGMPKAFDFNGADFTGISLDRGRLLYIAKVVHQANIEVDEEGTTAAAATVAAEGWSVSGPGPTPPPKVIFRVDRPFLFFIHDSATGAILFAGRIDDPSATS
jgi:serpin B